LSTLGVPDLVFERMQASVLTQLNAMLNDSVAALEILQVWLTSTKIILGRSYKKPVNVCNLSSTEVI
jgi:hypothetical protein